jgi:hypothetical protein
VAEAERQDPLREVEEIHRRILARLDESDRKAAAREKEREKQREELRARLAVHGSGSEAGANQVTPEERLTRLEEVTTVSATLLHKLEQNVDRLERVVEQLAETVAAHQDGIAELRATQVNLMKTFDQFIRGQEGNGRKQ